MRRIDTTSIQMPMQLPKSCGYMDVFLQHSTDLNVSLTSISHDDAVVVRFVSNKPISTLITCIGAVVRFWLVCMNTSSSMPIMRTHHLLMNMPQNAVHRISMVFASIRISFVQGTFKPPIAIFKLSKIYKIIETHII